MTEVTIRELRQHGENIINRVAAGERIVVTRGGRPMAELRPLRSTAATATILLQRWRRLAVVDDLRADLDAPPDPS